MNNYDDVIGQMTAAGLVIEGGLDADGRIVRVHTTEDREKRGWYCLHEWQASNGSRYIVGSFGVWHGTDNGAQKIEIGKQEDVSAEERAALRKRIAEDKKKSQARRAAESARAARRAVGVWRKAMTSPPDGVEVDYLGRKQVQSHGLRYTESGALVVPMMDVNRNVHGLQFILPSHHERRKKTGRDKEYWPKGLSKQGHFYPIGSIHGAPVVLVAEGYATGATAYEAVDVPTAIAFDAGNLGPVVGAIKKANRHARILILADDDYLTDGNPGVARASAAAIEHGCEWIKPEFPADREGKKLTDYNDLHLFQGGGHNLVFKQINAKLDALGWLDAQASAARSRQGGGDDGVMPARLTVDDAVARYWGTYGLGGEVLFDEVDRRLVAKKDVINLLPRHGWDDLRSHYAWRVARDTEIGFDPTEADPDVRCNLYGGWPTTPKAGKCDTLLELLEYLCNNEDNGREVYQWLLKWLAYPLQHRGAKMHSAIVVHGPQGTGKSRFFEAIVKIYGVYGRVLGQEALEDKFNADWAEKKLFILADEVLARQEMYHVKNRLKGFITGDTIRVNPKGVAAHTEKNQMNIVFLSNEHQPIVLENDDRRHCVIWVPPKPNDQFFHDLNVEIDNGGIEALHQYLLDLDLGDFKPWTKPPMTGAKQDLINLGISSSERFIREWCRLELTGDSGDTIPLCPCLGSHLYKLYERWCRQNGEFRPRPSNQFIGYLAKLPGWRAGNSERTYADLSHASLESGRFKNRKMVIPSDTAMNDALAIMSDNDDQDRLILRDGEAKSKWLTRGYLAFESAMGWSE